MKKYINPELKELAFVAEEAISGAWGGNLDGSNVANDVDMSKLLGGSKGQLNN